MHKGKVFTIRRVFYEDDDIIIGEDCPEIPYFFFKNATGIILRPNQTKSFRLVEVRKLSKRRLHNDHRRIK